MEKLFVLLAAIAEALNAIADALRGNASAAPADAGNEAAPARRGRGKAATEEKKDNSAELATLMEDVTKNIQGLVKSGKGEDIGKLMKKHGVARASEITEVDKLKTLLGDLEALQYA